MSITLPDAATATTDSNAAITAETLAAQTVFVAQATVLIDTAISNGLFLVQPFLPALVTSEYVTTYFTALGYLVLYPIYPNFSNQFNPPFIDGFPEVLPPGYVPWNVVGPLPGPVRIQISWPTT